MLSIQVSRVQIFSPLKTSRFIYMRERDRFTCSEALGRGAIKLWLRFWWCCSYVCCSGCFWCRWLSWWRSCCNSSDNGALAIEGAIDKYPSLGSVENLLDLMFHLPNHKTLWNWRLSSCPLQESCLAYRNTAMSFQYNHPKIPQWMAVKGPDDHVAYTDFLVS